MAYTPYQPGYNNQLATPQVIPQIQQVPLQQSQSSNLPTVGVYWVQGLEGAKGYQVNVPNTEVYLRDAEDNKTMYIKTTDSMGRPMSLKRYRMEEDPIQEFQSQDTSNFVTRDELKSTLKEMFEEYIPQISFEPVDGNQNRPAKTRNRNHNKGGNVNGQ